MKTTKCRARWLFAVAYLALIVGACGDSGSSAESSISPSPTTSTYGGTSTSAEPPAVVESTAWPVSTPEEQGMDSSVLAELVDAVVAEPGIDSVTVVRNGHVVMDTVVYPFPESTSHIIHSCTKSITATLIGIAIDQGLLSGVDVPVVEILADAAPETVGDLKASLTVEDLLTMSTGLECRDSYLYEWRGLREMQASDDWTAHVLALPMAEEPGTRFEYCNGSSFLLSAILSEVTGKLASDFAADVLFEPLGITEFVWPTSPDGITIGWGELMLRPEDMAKFGYLYLRDGEWDGEQLVPQEWVEVATTAQIDAGTLSDGYGYQWWVDDAGHVMAQGFGGQHIIVIPDHDLTVTFTSGLVGERHSWPEELTAEYVVAAVLSDHPLAADLEAQERLTAAVTVARDGPAPAIVDMPAMAATIDGVRYEIRDGGSGANWFEFRFRDSSAVFTTDEGNGPTDVQVRLDGRFMIDEASQIALRGAWRGDDTFVVEYQMIGQVERGTVEFIFEDDVAHVTTREPATGTIQSAIADRSAD